jgi:hypothetical protein
MQKQSHPNSAGRLMLLDIGRDPEDSWQNSSIWPQFTSAELPLEGKAAARTININENYQ